MLLVLLALCATFTFLTVGFYDKLECNTFRIGSSKLPPAFDGFRIVVIADLHGYAFGAVQETLLAAVEKEAPDMIALCGDIMDRDDTSLDNVEALLAGIMKIAPVYAIPGNHEMGNISLFAQLIAMYEAYGVVYMDGQSMEITRGEASITINSGRLRMGGIGPGWITAVPAADENAYNILLYHFGDAFNTVSRCGHDLVLAGHTHGGLVRLFGKGMFNTNGSLFVQYDKGLFRENGSTMVLSSGLGDSGFPRFYNRRELVTVILECE